MTDQERERQGLDEDASEDLDLDEEAADHVTGGAEALSLNFQKIKVEYKPQTGDDTK